MKRPYTYLGAATFLISAVVVAIALPHRCIEVAVACAYHEVDTCGRICSGAGVLLRAGVAATGLVLALLAGLVARRSPN